jgi:hypothetical protein
MSEWRSRSVRPTEVMIDHAVAAIDVGQDVAKAIQLMLPTPAPAPGAEKADAARQRSFEMRRSSGDKSARGFSRFRSIEPTEFKRTQDAMRTRARARAERHSVRDR